MFWALLEKDFRLFINRPAFRVFLAIMVMAVGGVTAVGITRYKEAVSVHDRWETSQRESISALKLPLSLLGPGITQSAPPEPLAIVARGDEDLIVAPFITTNWHKQVTADANDRGPISALIPVPDMSFVFFFLLPLLCLFLCLGSLLDELAQKTFLITLLYNASPRQVVVAKFVSATTAIVVPVLVVYAVAVAVLGRLTEFTIERYLRAALIVIPIVASVVFWVSVSLLTQVVWRTRRSSCAGALLIWACAVFLLPQVALSALRARQPLSTNAAYYERRASLERHYRASGRSKTYDINQLFRSANLAQRALDKAGEGDNCASLRAYDLDIRQNVSVMYLSTYYLSTYVASTLANTGLSDYLLFRNEMTSYRMHYTTKLLDEMVRPWAAAGKPPLDILATIWSVPWQRETFSHSRDQARRPCGVLLLISGFAAALALGAAPAWMDRRRRYHV